MSDSRLEKFIYAICSMEVSDLPVPLSRIEKLWNCLITGETPDFEPLSRNEKYLMAMLDRYDISNLPAPMSRGEKLLYKIAVGETDLSDVPGYLSRYEELLKYLIENGGIGFEYVLYTINQSLYTLYTTAEKPVKSAILSGMTLVNIFTRANKAHHYSATNNGKKGFTMTGDGTVTCHSWWNLELSTTKQYILTFDINVNTADQVFLIKGNDEKGIKQFPIGTTGKQTVIFTPTASDIRFKVEQYVNGTIIVDNIMLMEYQEGMENWDIPYFEGMQSVKMPVLTTSNEDGTKTNILTANEEVELRGIGDVQDELDLLTGEVTERIGEIVLDGSEDENWNILGLSGSGLSIGFYISINNKKNVDVKCDKLPLTHYDDIVGIKQGGSESVIQIRMTTEYLTSLDLNSFKIWLAQNPLTIQYKLATESIKTVDLTTVDQDGQPTKLKTFNDITHVEIKADNLIPSVDLEVATKISETLSTMGPQQLDISETQNKLGQTIDEQTENTDAAMMATTEIYEQTL